MRGNNMDISATRPLGRMLSLKADARKLWGENELQDLLAHQLQAPLEADLGPQDPQGRRPFASQTTRPGKPPATFRELLFHPHPPVELLEWVKEFGKAQLTGEESLLPEGIARFLYYTSIAVARRRCKRRISRLKDKQIRAGLEWLVDQPWLNAEPAGLCRELLAGFEPEATDAG